MGDRQYSLFDRSEKEMYEICEDLGESAMRVKVAEKNSGFSYVEKVAIYNWISEKEKIRFDEQVATLQHIYKKTKGKYQQTKQLMAASCFLMVAIIAILFAVK